MGKMYSILIQWFLEQRNFNLGKFVKQIVMEVLTAVTVLTLVAVIKIVAVMKI